MTSQDGLVLVYGATGQQGGPVARQLLQAERRIRVLTRNAARAESLRVAGAEVAVGDLGDPASLGPASEGVEAVFFHSPLEFDTDVGITYGRNAIDAAGSAGISLFVFDTSFPVPSSPTGVAAIDIRFELEAYLKSSGIPNIIIRPPYYTENFSYPFAAPADVVHQGVLRYPPMPREVRVSWITMQDVGSLVVEALNRPELAGSVFEVGGPEALTGDDVAERFAAILDRPVTYEPFSPDQYEQILNAAMGEPIGTEVTNQVRYYSQNPDLVSVSDMGPVLEKLPVRLTTLSEWAATVPWRTIAGPAPSEASR
ncbi:MAG: NmrA family NAD(P)-binding protein [Actinomycetota bacterium]|nr:NmrA family NAD(P)-binding protein [Actinomycetota bacterium]